jgi:tetratricopeptide (TPR) repeat protein
MKAERRHELKHNVLADWIGERVETAKPHATGVLLGAGLLFVLVLGSIWYFGGENHASARAWGQYFEAFNEREPQKTLQNLAVDQLGSKAAWWALESVGDMNLGEGAALLYSDRSEAQKRLEAAERAYKQVEASSDPMLKSRARLGLAKVYESLCKPDEARKYYEMVAAGQKNSAIGKSAAADAKRMKDTREIAFLEWFAKQTPKRPAPFPGAGGGVPALPGSLPEMPDIGLSKGLGLDNIGTLTPTEPASSFPAPGATLPATALPDAAAPDAKAPNATKPPDVKPAEAPPAATPPDEAKPAAPDAGEKKPD